MYILEEITVLTDDTTPVSISVKSTYEEAYSTFHQVLASASINDKVSSCHVEIKDMLGNTLKSDTYIVATPEPEEEE